MNRSAINARFFGLALTATSLCTACTAGEDGELPNIEPPNIYATPVPRFINYDLKITTVANGDYNELSPVQVNYEFTATKSGISGPEPANPTVWICPEFENEAALGGECKPIDTPRLGRTYRGSIMAISPWAGMNSKVRIVALKSAATYEDYGQRVVVQSASAPLPTAATYRINFDGFELITTRSASTDTVWLDMQGLIKSDPAHRSESDDACQYIGPKWCLRANYYGDVHDSGYRATPGRWIEDFRLTPEKEEDLRFYYTLYNLGDHKWEEIARGIGDAFSKVGLVILTAYGAYSGQNGYGSAATLIDEQIEKLHAAGTAECDGPLAVDRVLISNRSSDGSNMYTLDGFTRATGYKAFEPTYIYQNKDGDYRCDRSGSRYKIRWSLVRTSWKSVTPWPE
jgi:hypothetical protein